MSASYGVVIWLACSGATDPKESVDSASVADTSDSGSATDTAEDSGTAEVQRLSINELMADNKSSWSPDDISWPDWIELYNPGQAAVDLLGWRITDNPADTESPGFSASLVVPAGGFLLLVADGLPELGPEHLALKLDSSGEDLLLFAPDGRRVQWVSYDDQLPDISVARKVDGSEEDGWLYVAGGTPGASNQP